MMNRRILKHILKPDHVAFLGLGVALYMEELTVAWLFWGIALFWDALEHIKEEQKEVAQ